MKSARMFGVGVIGSAALASLLSACGQGSEGGVSLEVQMLSVSGVLEGNELSETTYSVAQGERLGEHGTFLFDGRDTTIQVSACPLDETQVDPYGGLGEPPGTSIPGEPTPTDPRGEIPVETRPDGTSGRVGGCVDRSIFVCNGPSCASFGTDEVALEIHEEGQWRRLVLDGDNAVGTVQIELLYRERR